MEDEPDDRLATQYWSASQLETQIDRPGSGVADALISKKALGSEPHGAPRPKLKADDYKALREACFIQDENGD